MINIDTQWIKNIDDNYRQKYRQISSKIQTNIGNTDIKSINDINSQIPDQDGKILRNIGSYLSKI